MSSEIRSRESSLNTRRKIGTTGCLFGCLGVALVIIGLPLVFLLVWTSVAARSAQERIDSLEARGYPVSVDELDGYYKLDQGAVDATELWIEGTNAFDGPEYELYAKPLPIVGAGAQEIPPANAEWKQLEDVERLLVNYEHGLAKMHEAAERGGKIRLPHKFSDGLGMLLPEVQKLRAGARMLQLEAHVRAHRHDPQGVVKALSSLVALSRANDADPILVSQLVNIAIASMAIATLEEVLPFVDFSDEQLAELQDLFGSGEAKLGIKISLLGERAMGISTFQNPGKTMPTETSSFPFGSRNDDLCFYLDLLEPVIEATSEESWTAALDASQQMEVEFGQKMSSPVNKFRYTLTGMFVPAMSSVIDAGARSDALGHIAEVACAVQRYRKANGEYPSNLEDLVPQFLAQVRADPYDDQPLRYELRDGSPVVWSVGRDRVDNGGVENEDTLEPDICFAIPDLE